MIVKRELQTGDVVIEVRGNILGDAVEEFREALYGAIDSPCRTILLDLEKVRTMNSRAIGVLLLARKKVLLSARQSKSTSAIRGSRNPCSRCASTASSRCPIRVDRPPAPDYSASRLMCPGG
ncbi:MAG: STAS domain-containing protein [Spirochaetes bacterium]|nr:STAS domain-containing protein [Spirochaetota bacterium]